MIGNIDLDQNFFCSMIPGLGCKVIKALLSAMVVLGLGLIRQDEEEEWEEENWDSSGGGIGREGTDRARNNQGRKRPLNGTADRLCCFVRCDFCGCFSCIKIESSVWCISDLMLPAFRW